MQPPPFPRVEADLDAWHVYADWLIDRGDPRGELIALDLSLPAQPTAEELARFHATAKRVMRHRSMAIGWCLNHVRTLAIERTREWMMGRDSGRPAIDAGLLFNLAEFVSTPIASRLEELHVAANAADAGERGWRRLMRRLPLSCHTIALEIEEPNERAVRRIFDELPPSVRSMRMTARRPELFVDDRLDVLVLPFLDEVEPIAEALARTRQVRLRVGGLRTSVGLENFASRVVAGDDGDVLLRGADGAFLLLARPTLFALQRRFGLVPIRTQLARALPERHAFAGWRTGQLRIVDSSEADILRHPDGRFTLRNHGGEITPPFAVSRNGAVVGEQLVPVVDGDRLTIDGKEWLFSTTGGGRSL